MRLRMMMFRISQGQRNKVRAPLWESRARAI